MPVLLDGGVRRGTDVVIARALGASACLLGRPLWGVSVAGEGVFGICWISTRRRSTLLWVSAGYSIDDISADVLANPPGKYSAGYRIMISQPRFRGNVAVTGITARTVSQRLSRPNELSLTKLWILRKGRL